MILLLGDSNFRNTIETYSASLNAQVKDTVIFEFCSSVESVKLATSNREVTPTVILYGAPFNEVVTKVAKNPAIGRDEMVKRVAKDFVGTVVQSARDHPTTLHLIIPPFMRQEPKWAEEKSELMLYYMSGNVTKSGLTNLAIGSKIDISPEDLSNDKVHLNDQGKEKLYGILESDINKCKEDVEGQPGEGQSSQSQSWASQMSFTAPKTPAALRKRQRTTELDTSDNEMDTSRKMSRIDALFDKLEVVLGEMRENRSGTDQKVQQIETKIDEADDKINSVMAKVDKLEDAAEMENNITAEMRDDIDSLENENLKSVVVVRKLKAAVEVPTEKKALRSFIQNVARELVEDVLGATAKEEVKYASTLYSFIDPTKRDNQKGLIPPFRIGFKTKDMGVKFREEAVKKAKQEGSKLSSTYFTHCQSSATRIRVMLLWGIVDALKPTNPDIWVSQNASRPTLQIKENGKVRTYTFVKAMDQLGSKIAKKTLEEATKIGNKFYKGQLKKTFLILKD